MSYNHFADPKSLFTGGFWKKTSGLLFIWRLQQSSAIFRGDVDQNNKNLVQLWLLAVVQPSILESKVFSSLLVSSPFSCLTLSLISYLLLSLAFAPPLSKGFTYTNMVTTTNLSIITHHNHHLCGCNLLVTVDPDHNQQQQQPPQGQPEPHHHSIKSLSLKQDTLAPEAFPVFFLHPDLWWLVRGVSFAIKALITYDSDFINLHHNIDRHHSHNHHVSSKSPCKRNVRGLWSHWLADWVSVGTLVARVTIYYSQVVLHWYKPTVHPPVSSPL